MACLQGGISRYPGDWRLRRHFWAAGRLWQWAAKFPGFCSFQSLWTGFVCFSATSSSPQTCWAFLSGTKVLPVSDPLNFLQGTVETDDPVPAEGWMPWRRLDMLSASHFAAQRNLESKERPDCTLYLSSESHWIQEGQWWQSGCLSCFSAFSLLLLFLLMLLSCRQWIWRWHADAKRYSTFLFKIFKHFGTCEAFIRIYIVCIWRVQTVCTIMYTDAQAHTTMAIKQNDRSQALCSSIYLLSLLLRTRWMQTVDISKFRRNSKDARTNPDFAIFAIFALYVYVFATCCDHQRVGPLAMEMDQLHQLQLPSGVLCRILSFTTAASWRSSGSSYVV